jgi:ankyrin repeat protein
MLAARAGSVDAVRVLLAHGADPDAREDERGTSALMQAADQGHADVIALLVEHGADVSAGSAPVMRGGRTAALGKANDPRNSVRLQVRQVLCELASSGSAVPEVEAGISEDEAVARSLQNSGPLEGCDREVDALGFVRGTRGDDDTIPRDDADAADADTTADASDADDAEAEDPPARRQFGRGAAREPDGGELTPLVYAARTGAIDAARALLEAGADVNQLTRYGWSPLLAATQNRNYQMGRFLIENGADVNIANKGGWTPLYLATDNRNLLLLHGHSFERKGILQTSQGSLK